VEPGPLIPALHSYWVPIHVTAVIIAGGAFMVSGVTGITYLVSHRAEAKRALGEKVAGIAGRLRAQDSGAQAQTAQLDPWIRNQLREQNPAGQAVSGTGSTVTQPSQSQHDSGISAQLRARTGNAAGCVPAAPGAGGWEARLAYGC
jgi:hypothetical protein